MNFLLKMHFRIRIPLQHKIYLVALLYSDAYLVFAFAELSQFIMQHKLMVVVVSLPFILLLLFDHTVESSYLFTAARSGINRGRHIMYVGILSKLQLQRHGLVVCAHAVFIIIL